jgi:hypothetical protein
MKGKITIVLLSLVLVFGMIAASCGDGDYPENPYKTQDPNNKKKATDYKPSPLAPSALNIKLAALKAETGGITLGVLSSASTWDGTNKVVKVEGGTGTTGFSITFASLTPAVTITAGHKIKITYSCVVDEESLEAGSVSGGTGQAHTIAKTGATSFTDFTPAQYPRFEEGTANIVTITTGATDDVTGIKFQHNNGDGPATYYIKVTNVEDVP